MLAAEMQRYAQVAVQNRSADGRKRAIAGAARDLGLTPRRVAGLLHGEVARVWADELLSARAWYRGHLARMATQSEQAAALFRTQIEEWDRHDA